MNPFNKITVLLADDHAPVRRGLRTLLDGDSQILVVGEARDGQEAVEMARKYRPNVILMDISMPIINGLEATRQILAERSSAKIIVLSAHDDEGYMERATEIGAVGFVRKQMLAESLTWIIHEAAMGRSICNPVKTADLHGRSKAPDRNGAARSKRERLNSRESELLQLVAEGSPKRKIAAKLRVSVATVERQLEALMDKLSIPGIANLANYATSHGFVETDVMVTIT